MHSSFHGSEFESSEWYDTFVESVGKKLDIDSKQIGYQAIVTLMSV